MNPKVLPAKVEDASLLTIIAISSKGYWGYSEALLTSWIPELMISEEIIASYHAFKLVLGNEIVGFYVLTKEVEQTIALEYLFVLPSYIGNGYGKQLLLHAIQQARMIGVKAIKVLSDPNAELFYVRYGFRKIGAHKSSVPDRFLPIMILGL